MKGIELEVVEGPFSQISADTFVVPVPSNERPLRGFAGQLDWRLCGRISEALRAGTVSGAPHEALLLPAAPPLHATRLMLIGIGLAETQPGRGVQDAFRDLSSRLLALCAERAAVLLPAAIDLVQDAESALRGCLQSMSSFRGEGVLRLALPGDRQLARSLWRAAENLLDDASRRQVRLFVEMPQEVAASDRKAERFL